jgi:hypothetical protein
MRCLLARRALRGPTLAIGGGGWRRNLDIASVALGYIHANAVEELGRGLRFVRDPVHARRINHGANAVEQ